MHYAPTMNDDPQLNLFVADIIDVSPKSDIDSMEIPLFSLSKKPDTELFRYEKGKQWIEVSPGQHGRPTIFDKDLLMYAIGQIMEGINRERPVSRRVKITGYDYMRATARGTNGRAYESMILAANRLRGLTITTNMSGEGDISRRANVFGLVDEVVIIEKKGERALHFEITLSERLFADIEAKRVLTYNPAYFQLTSPIKRRLYELCRKHCGNQKFWQIGFEKLFKKVGTRGNNRLFRGALNKTIQSNDIPDYILHMDLARDVLMVERKKGWACG